MTDESVDGFYLIERLSEMLEKLDGRPMAQDAILEAAGYFVLQGLTRNSACMLSKDIEVAREKMDDLKSTVLDFLTEYGWE